MARSRLTLLSEFEIGLAEGRFSGLEEYYSSLAADERTPQVVEDIARAELSLSQWPCERLNEILEFVDDNRELDGARESILQGVYCDRIDSGESPSIAEFQSFDLANVALHYPRDPFRLTTTSDSYQFVRRIGAGGFGVVFECQTPSGERVALKAPVEVEDDLKADIAREQLRAESAAAQQLIGAHFPRFIEWIELEGKPCLVTEFIVGESVGEKLSRGAFDVQFAASLVADVSIALYLAHCKGLLHRDIKPSNIMVRDDGRAVLLDFGLVVTEEELIGLEGQIAGTPGRQSPDAILGNLPDMDARGDVWALGPLLHECVTGKALFNPAHREDALASAITAAVLPSDAPEIPPELNKIVQKCIQANPILRYDTALDCACDLVRFCDPSLELADIVRAPLQAFRIGREFGEAQCHIDACQRQMLVANDNVRALRLTTAPLFMVNEEIRHAKLLLDREPFDNETWPEFSHDVISNLFYTSSTISLDRYSEIQAAAESAVTWLQETCEQIQDVLSSEAKSTQALFELGLVATLPKSDEPREIDISHVALLTELPDEVWSRYSEYLQQGTGERGVHDEFRRLSKKVEHHYLYGSGRSKADRDNLAMLMSRRPIMEQ